MHITGPQKQTTSPFQTPPPPGCYILPSLACMDGDSPPPPPSSLSLPPPNLTLLVPPTLLARSDERLAASPANAGQQTPPGRHPKYKGIRCRGGKWVSEIREPRKSKRIWLGTYPAAEMAAVAYDVAALALKGADAALNFPHMVTCHPVPASISPSDIQAAAAAAAAAVPFPKKPLQSSERTATTSPIVAAAGKKEGGQVTPATTPQEERSTTTARSTSTSDQDETMASTAITAASDFMDEEEMFNMPKLLESMAEAMLMSPPRIRLAHSDDESPEASDADSLWSYQ